MATQIIRIDAKPTGIEITGEGTAPTDEQMKAELKARDTFVDKLSPLLAELPGRPLRRAGNVSKVELLGGDTWSNLNHYLVIITSDTGGVHVDWDTLGPKVDVMEVGSYGPLQTWPDKSADS